MFFTLFNLAYIFISIDFVFFANIYFCNDEIVLQYHISNRKNQQKQFWLKSFLRIGLDIVAENIVLSFCFCF